MQVRAAHGRRKEEGRAVRGAAGQADGEGERRGEGIDRLRERWVGSVRRVFGKCVKSV